MLPDSPCSAGPTATLELFERHANARIGDRNAQPVFRPERPDRGAPLSFAAALFGHVLERWLSKTVQDGRVESLSVRCFSNGSIARTVGP